LRTVVLRSTGFGKEQKENRNKKMGNSQFHVSRNGLRRI
jgi:hypothetical protein